MKTSPILEPLSKLSLSSGLPLLLVTLLIPACDTGVTDEPETPREIATYDAETFFDTVSISGASFSADESKILLSSDETGTINVFAQPVDGGERQQLTDSTDNAHIGITWFPNDDRFLFTADQGGNELNHLYVRELDGSDRDLTPGENLKAQFYGFSGDDASFWVTTNERDPKFFDLYRYAADGYERELVFENDGYFVSGVSDDERWIALTKIVDNSDSDVYVLDRESGETTHVTPHEGKISHGAAGFTPDSKQLLYSTNEHGEFTQVWSYDLATGERAPLVEADWDVAFVAYSETGRYRGTAINADAKTEITILDTETGEELEFPEVGPGDVTTVNFSPSEQKMLFYVGNDRSPANLYVWDLDPSSEPLQLTERLSPEVNVEDLVEGEVVRYESYDGLEIPGILYRPHGASADNPVPALLAMHGGPGGQSRHGYRETWQFLINHGYAIFAVNNRGSSGYGKTFFHLDDKKHGEADLGDCVAAKDYLATLDWVDGDKIGIMGGSYGGYLVAAALAFEPEAFEVGIDIFGVTNWVRTLESIPPWWTAQRESLYAELGDPATDGERLRRISPLFHASNIVRPLLVVQGANDPRVLQVESDELVEAARANGVPVEYIVFPDEGHGFRRTENQITAAKAYLAFLDEHLKGEAPAPEEVPGP